MFGTDKRYLSIAINETTITLAQVRSSGAVEKVAHVLIAAGAPKEDQVRAIKALLNGFDRRAPVLCVIPASAATSKSIEIPSSDPAEIKSIINLQVSRHTPYSREEVLVGHINLGTTSGTNTLVLLVIAYRQAVKDRLDTLEKCGLVPVKALFAPEGIGRLYTKGLNLKKSAGSLGIIDFAAGCINFIVIAHGSVVFARSIPLGIKDLTGDAGGVAKITEEIGKSLTSYLSEEVNSPVESYVLSTDHEAVKNIVPSLKESLKAEIGLSPYLDLVKAKAVKASLLKNYPDDSFLDVVASAVACLKSEIDLMPSEMTHQRTVERQSKEAAIAGIAAVAIMILLGATFMSRIYFKDTFLNKNLRDNFAAKNEEARDLQDRMAKTKVVREYLQGRMTSLDTIQELYRITPTSIYLTGASLDDDGTISLVGVSSSMSQVFSYVKALDDSPMFMNAKTKSTSTKKDGDKDVAIFEVTLKLDDGPKE